MDFPEQETFGERIFVAFSRLVSAFLTAKCLKTNVQMTAPDDEDGEEEGEEGGAGCALKSFLQRENRANIDL